MPSYPSPSTILNYSNNIQPLSARNDFNYQDPNQTFNTNYIDKPFKGQTKFDFHFFFKLLNKILFF